MPLNRVDKRCEEEDEKPEDRCCGGRWRQVLWRKMELYPC